MEHLANQGTIDKDKFFELIKEQKTVKTNKEFIFWNFIGIEKIL